MKAVILIMVALTTTAAYGGDMMVFRKGVKFNHQSHQSERVGICAICHEHHVGKIALFGKGWAHRNCIDCHDLFREGPTECSGCHSRS